MVSESRSQKLEDLIRGLDILQTEGPLSRSIHGIACHSSDVGEGYLFVAISGTRQDGHDFLVDACDRGATALVVERIIQELSTRCTQIQVPNAREALASLAASYYDHPARQLTLVGITGTNGKTTTAYILEAILQSSGLRVGVVGTIEYRFENRCWPAPTTTPESLDLQRLLREMADAGATHVIMEVTSHALTQYRVHGCVFQVAVFTNLSRDHLDYHRTMDEYLSAKRGLFEGYLLPEAQGGTAIMNMEDSVSNELAARCQGRVMGFGDHEGVDFQAREWAADLDGIQMTILYPEGEMTLSSSLLGEPNVHNILAACASAWALDVEPRYWTSGLQQLKSVRGRFEPLRNSRGVTVIVDYAHTPDALDRVLRSARRISSGKLICVFGCGGDRDQGKRPLMAKAAARHSDLVVVTSDNPRSESPAMIIHQIINGFNGIELRRIALPEEPEDAQLPAYSVLEDRSEAIRWAIRRARPGDLVLIAGKGHEDYQIIGAHRIHLDDREVAAQALTEVDG